MVKRLINKVVNSYLRKTDPVKWAKRLGVKVGEHTVISPDTHFPSEPYLVAIGNHVQIAPSVSIYTHGGSNCIRKNIPDFDAFGKILIEDWVYIGSNSLIMPGVTIGEGALVAAGSVVTKSVAPRTVVGGNPAKLIGTIDEYASRNIKFNAHTKGLSYNEKKRYLLSLSEDKFIKK